MSDLKPFTHGEEGTHSACNARIKKEGGKAQCCGCVPHDGCEMADTTKQDTSELDIHELRNFLFALWRSGRDGEDRYESVYKVEEYLTQALQKQRQELLDHLLKNGHGGGNWRRLIEQKRREP